MWRLMRSCLLASVMLSGFATHAWCAVTTELEGQQIEDSFTVSGTKLVLNGASVRKRAYFKTELVALYLPERKRNLDAVNKLPGAKRVQITILRTLSGSVLSRYFINDFKAETTDEEFKSLINEVGIIGGYYASMHQLNRGDTVSVDWVPELQGIVAFVNGKQMGPPMKSEAMYQVLLRMFIAPMGSSQDYRDAMMSAK